MTLAEFVKARLDEQEREALKRLDSARLNVDTLKDVRFLGRELPGWHEWPAIVLLAKRSLEDVVAKRRILQQYVFAQSMVEAGEHSWSLILAGAEHAVRSIAMIDGDHFDFDRTWLL